MKVDKNYCMSSYLTVRFVDNPDIIFKKDIVHKDHELLADSEKYPCSSAKDIDYKIQEQLEAIDLSRAGVFLSGGMDSAILASYMPKGTKCYTSRCVGSSAVDETEMAKKFCDAYDLEHIIVDVTWEDYIDSMEPLMIHDGAPIIPNEPQAYILSKKAKADGIETIVYGDCADTEFGGMTKLLAVDWKYEDFKKRFTFLEPSKVLVNPVDMDHIYAKYKIGGDGIDYVKFIAEPYAKSAAGALTNAMECVGLNYIDPYEHLCLDGPLDIQRVRSGESKYLIRDLFKMRYPNITIPEKLPMSRPANEWLRDWEGPSRKEFIPHCVESLNGEQKLLLYSLERFLNIVGCVED